jgi:hypothetical protein
MRHDDDHRGSRVVAEPGRALHRRADQQVATRGSHRSVPELTASIQSWIDTWNQHPRPLVWTKTAGQILENIPRYLQRISNSGY